MKFFSTFGILSTCVAAVSAHSSMLFPAPRGHPQNPNAAVKDYNCITAPLNPGTACSGKTFPCGGYPMDTQITQVFHAGDIVSVKFWNPQFPNGPQPGDAGANQARHNGGLCEFALSYDGGVTYTVIGTYHETCPDIFFDWKVKIPEGAPSCDNPGKCIFSWSWINAVGNREFYQNCADIKLVGNSTKPLPIIDITRANLPPQFPQVMTPPGDPDNSGNAEGSGPSASDVSANLGQNIGGSGGSASNTGNTGTPTPSVSSASSPSTSLPSASSPSESPSVSSASSPSSTTTELSASPKSKKNGGKKGGKKGAKKVRKGKYNKHNKHHSKHHNKHHNKSHKTPKTP